MASSQSHPWYDMEWLVQVHNWNQNSYHQMWIIWLYRNSNKLSLSEGIVSGVMRLFSFPTQAPSLEFFQSFCDCFIEGLVDPKWHPANDNHCFKDLVKIVDQLNTIPAKTWQASGHFWDITPVVTATKKISLTHIESLNDATPKTLRIED